MLCLGILSTPGLWPIQVVAVVLCFSFFLEVLEIIRLLPKIFQPVEEFHKKVKCKVRGLILGTSNSRDISDHSIGLRIISSS